MGLRYRKSINLGGGFRVNFSKSGVGYSWGTKGYRVTKKAGGGTRRTYSIPGTGLSWVDESGNGKRRSGGGTRSNYAVQPSNTTNSNYLYQATDANVSELVTDNSQDFIDAIKKFARIRGLLKWGSIISFLLMFGTLVFSVLFVACLIGLIYLNVAKKIIVEYEFDDYGTHRIQMLNQAVAMLCNNKMVWQINTIQANASRKVNAGASQSVGRKPVKFQKKKPYFLKTDAICYFIKLRNDQIFVLPDRLIVKGKKGWGVVEYSELDVGVGSTYFIENSTPPKDAKVVGYTWQYVNKNGSPDKRYKNNRQLPKCQYGELNFKSATGLNIILYISNVENARSFKSLLSQMIEEAKQMHLVTEQEMIQMQQASVSEPVYEDMPEQQEILEIRSYQEIADTKYGQGNRNTLFAPKTFDDFVLMDTLDSERNLLEMFWNGLISNGIQTSCKAIRQSDGSITIEYKGKDVGSFCLRSGNSWLSYPLGNSGKNKQVDGNIDELGQHVNKWIRYIMNYLV